MDIGEAVKAMKEGKKVRRKAMSPLWLDNNHIYISISESHTEGMHSLRDEDLLADDWELVEDIPEIKLQRSTDVYYECPKCKQTDSIIVYIENVKNNDTLNECRFCGQKFNIINLGESYNWSMGTDYSGIIVKYKNWLESTISDFETQINEYVENKQYIRAGNMQRGVESYKNCLEIMNKFERE